MSLRRNLRRYTRIVVNWGVTSWASTHRTKWTTLPPLERRTWSGKTLDEMTLEEAIDWAFTSPISDEEYARADALLAQMAEVAERNRRSSGTSYVRMRMPKP